MDYSKANIHVLRMYAKEIGVKSPSVYTKSVLIEKIKAVESGKTKPYFSKRGRPNSERLSICEKNAYQTNQNQKNALLFAINKAKVFLDELEKEIKEKY